jgi:hypothetical protein
MRMNLRLVIVALVGLLSLSGCWLSSSNDTTLTLAVADTPVDGAEHVVLTFKGVQLQPASGALIEQDYQVPMQIDLLQLQGDDYALLLDNLGVPAGSFTSIRLLVDMSQSSIMLSDGSVHPLVLPGSNQSSILLTSDFSVSSGEQAGYIIDFDLRKAVSQVSGGSNDYLLQPALQFLNGENTGEIHGIISNTFMIGSTAISDPSCYPTAYIYAGSNVTPVDINPTSKVQPIQTATVFLGQFSGNYYYHAEYLAAGNYTVALACAGTDNPSTSDNLSFAEPQNAPVTAGYLTEVDFP